MCTKRECTIFILKFPSGRLNRSRFVLLLQNLLYRLSYCQINDCHSMSTSFGFSHLFFKVIWVIRWPWAIGLCLSSWVVHRLLTILRLYFPHEKFFKTTSNSYNFNVKHLYSGRFFKPPQGVIGVYQYEKEANFSKIFSHKCKEKTKFMIINVHEALCKNCEIHGRWDNGSCRGANTAIE